MILPTKHLRPDRALISVASEIFEFINKRSTVSSIWNALQDKNKVLLEGRTVPFDWFILALDLLYLMDLVEEKSGFIVRKNKNDL